MKLVIDTNVVISALVRDGFSRKIILYENIELVSPEFSLKEIYKYKELILEKSGLTEEEFKNLLFAILSKIKIIPKSKYESFINKADELIGKIDPKDIPFLALALSFQNDGIWSDDAHFKKQNKIKAWTTKEIISIISK